ncbi:hypothetical protein F7725_006038 [Dissostichus mawsoni]|uniref:UTP--glucose-1-phosphate uridylyltransferase n=1 Tax=Dissostichus mawsoni TaxID=36200 RepID=A0A7J5YU36_DISMA|nr:hypothetical protein F7725_006038 [Dissostichus mawsoni]
MTEFQEKLKAQHEDSMHRELEALLGTANKAEAEISRKDFEGFKNLFHRFLQVKGPAVDWAKINRPPEESHLNKTFNADVPLVLMNSFNTDEDTKKILQKYKHHRVNIHTFNQSRYPRINKESLLPIAKNMSTGGQNGEAWYPPGHGDVYASFSNSGLLDKLLSEGKEYIFVSNIDNLGATVDLFILQHLMSQPADRRCEFIMEYEDHLRLLEIAQVPKNHVDEFKSVTKFKIFNTNNLWISLPAIKRLQDTNNMDLEIIVNPKVQQFLCRFESIPDMLELDHLTVSGDVTFGKNVSLKGTVIIIANHGDRIDIPAGAMLENKIVSGNLRILDH